MKKTNIFYGIVYAIVASVFFYIFWKVPYCHDEWKWGLQKNLDMLENWFDGYNGRYLGNLLALWITRSLFAKSVVLSLIMLLMVIVIKRYVTKKAGAESSRSIFVFVAAVVLLLAIPKTLFCQSYGWVAAYVNFVPPVVIFLFYYSEIEDVSIFQNKNIGTIKLTLMMILCFCAQLFGEHNTVFHVAFSLGLLIYGFVRYKKINVTNLMLFLSFSAGAFWMFSNSAYGNAVDKTDKYKEISFSIKACINCYVTEMADNLLLNNVILNLILITCCVWLVIKKINNRFWAVEMIYILSSYAVWGIWHKLNPGWNFVNSTVANDYIKAFIGIVFYLHILVVVIVTVEKEDKYSICIWYVSAVMVAGPLVMASPIGARCFYASYVFQLIACVKLLSYCLPEEINYTYGIVALGVVGITVSFVYLRMFREMGRFDTLRQEIIANAIETKQEEIVLPTIPYADYCWTTEPTTKTWKKRFKKFYGIPKNMEVTFSSYENFMARKNAHR